MPHTHAIRNTATQHGRDLFFEGLTIEQVVHDYGDVCQSVIELAGESTVPISTRDFQTLNRCLDDAIAGAVCPSSDANNALPQTANQSVSPWCCATCSIRPSRRSRRFRRGA
jgi:hypothetical protein